MVRLAVKLRDASGAEWTVDPVALTGAEWQDIQWSWRQFRIAGWSTDPDGRLDLPARDLAVIAFGLERRKRYELWIAKVEVLRHLVTVPGLRVQVPETIRADARLPIAVRFAGPSPAAPWWIDLTLNDRHVLRRKLGTLTSGKAVAVELPRYLAEGQYRIVYSLGDMPIVDERTGVAVVTPITIEPRRASADDTAAEVRMTSGVPTLHINGRPESCMVYMTYHPDSRYFSEFGQAGIRLFSFSSTPSASEYSLSPPTWVAPDTFDYTNLDERARLLLDVVPDAYFFPRIYLFSPAWWDEEHPDDLVARDPGDRRPVAFARDGKKRAPSWASETWRRDTARAIRLYIRHIERSPYADRVIGYHLASGTTEEWMMWGANENQWVDYSPVNVARFRAWLRERYGADDALRRAWRDDGVTLETAAIPGKARRARTLFGILRDPDREQDVVDYTLYGSDLVAETIGYFARVVKDATCGEKLVGVFYGYVLQLMGQRQQNAGHLALDKVLGNPDIDFVTSPTSYAFRTPGTGYSHFMSLTDSVKLHGKLWINENDIRTWLTPVKAGQWGKTDTYAETLKQEERELASVLGQGCGQWWFDMGGGWFDDSRMMAEIAKHKQIADRTLRRPRGGVAEIAVIVDDRSLAHLRPGNPLSQHLMLSPLPHIARTGAPVAYYALSDLAKAPKHRMYVFVNALAPDPEDRQAIDALKGDGRVLMFFWASGIYRDGRIDAGGVRDLVGMQVEMDEGRAPVSGRFDDGNQLLDGVAKTPVGVDVSVAPSFFVSDPEAAVLARDAKGQAVLAVRDHPGWTSVYSAVPVHSQAFYRNVAIKAGVHRYIDTPDVVYATQSLLGIACNKAGRRTVRLRRPAQALELFSDRIVSSGKAEFDIDIDEHGTALLLIDEAP